MIEPGLAHRLPLARHPGHDMIPPQRPDLLGPKARQQRQGDVSLQPRPPGRGHQGNRLLQGQRLGRPPAELSLRRLDQRRNVAAYQVIPLGLPDRPHQHIVRDLHRPGRQPRRQRPQRCLHVPGGQLRQPDSPQLLTKRLRDRVPVQGHRPGRQAVQANRQPGVQRVTHRVAPSRPQPAFHLLMQVPELIPDLSLGPSGDLVRGYASQRG